MSKQFREVAKSVGAGTEAAGFFGSIMSGFLLGLLLDWWLDTEPLFVICGIVAGSGTGFWKMWEYSKRDDHG